METLPLLMVLDTAITIPGEWNNVVARKIFHGEDGIGTIGRPNDVAEHFYGFYTDGRICLEIYSTAISNPDTDYFPTEPLLVETVKQIFIHHSNIINNVYEIDGEIIMEVAG